MRETHWKTETAYKYYFYREIEIFLIQRHFFFFNKEQFRVLYNVDDQ